jgi:hypothetical protein
MMSRFIQAIPGMKHSVIYSDDSGKHFRFSGGTLAWRNHNPGNVWPGHISKKNNQIGVAYKLAIFPDYQSGHDALLDVLKITYGSYSIPEMMKKYAPPHENNTNKYVRFVQEAAGVKDKKKIKNFTDEEFEKLWKAIEKMESSKIGDVIEVYQVTRVRSNKDGIICNYCVEDDDWVSIEQCLDLARKGQVDLEICISFLGNTYLRTAPNSVFQARLKTITDKIKE